MLNFGVYIITQLSKVSSNIHTHSAGYESFVCSIFLPTIWHLACLSLILAIKWGYALSTSLITTKIQYRFTGLVTIWIYFFLVERLFKIFAYLKNNCTIFFFLFPCRSPSCIPNLRVLCHIDA